MANDNIHRLQDTFLEHLQRKRTPVTIFLSNGVRLQGIVTGYDAFCVMLESNVVLTYQVSSITRRVTHYHAAAYSSGSAPR